jgi:hypothetical protein
LVCEDIALKGNKHRKPESSSNDSLFISTILIFEKKIGAENSASAPILQLLTVLRGPWIYCPVQVGGSFPEPLGAEPCGGNLPFKLYK